MARNKTKKTDEKRKKSKKHQHVSLAQTVPDTGGRKRTPSDCHHSRSHRGEEGNLQSGLDAARDELRQDSRCGCIPSKASSKNTPPFCPKCKERWRFIQYSTVVTFPGKYVPGMLYDDPYHTGTRAGVQTNTSLEPDPRRVLRSLGKRSSPAARTATTYTWARGGAQGSTRTASYTIQGAAWHRGLHSSSSKESKRPVPAT